MLTSQEAERFADAVAASDPTGYRLIEADGVASICEPVSYYIERWGKPDRVFNNEHGELYIWMDIQRVAGLMPGNLYVMDFGKARAAFLVAALVGKGVYPGAGIIVLTVVCAEECGDIRVSRF